MYQLPNSAHSEEEDEKNPICDKKTNQQVPTHKLKI